MSICKGTFVFIPIYPFWNNTVKNNFYQKNLQHKIDFIGSSQPPWDLREGNERIEKEKGEEEKKKKRKNKKKQKKTTQKLVLKCRINRICGERRGHWCLPHSCNCFFLRPFAAHAKLEILFFTLQFFYLNFYFYY